MKDNSKLIVLGLIALLVFGFIFYKPPTQTGTQNIGVQYTEDPIIGVQYIDGAVGVQFFTTPGGVTITFEGKTLTTNDVANTACAFGFYDSSVATSYAWSAHKTGYSDKTGTLQVTVNQRYASVYITLTATGGTGGGGTTPSLYQITIKTTPASCTATINGDARGTGTNGAIFTLTSGTTYTVSVSKEHYLTQSQTFTVSKVATYSFTMQEDPNNPLPPPPAPTYTLTVTTTPSDCMVTVTSEGAPETKASGTTGAKFYGLYAGQYYVTVKKTGYVDVTSSPVYIDSTQSVPYTLSIVPPTTYTLTVITTPSDCAVTINGVTKQSGTLGAIFTGLTSNIYGVSVSKSGYTSQTNDVNVDSTKQVTISLVVIPVTITIITQPSEATVVVNGVTESSGTTGAIFTNLNPGQYAVTVSKQGYVTTTEQVIATVDTTRTVTLYVTQQPNPNNNTTPLPVPTTHTLTINTVPSNAFVQINNVGNIYASNGKAVFYNVADGVYTCTVNLTGYDDLSSPVTMHGKDTTYTFSMDKRTATQTPNKTPGFEIIPFIAALGIAMILIRKRKK